MVYFGTAGVILAVYMIWREYCAYLESELDWCAHFLRALVDYRDKVKCYMDTPSGWASAYTDELLTECGFLPHISESGDFRLAYSEARLSATITDEADEVLRGCFERLGEGYLESETETLSLAIEKLKREEEKLRSAISGKRKAVGAMLGAFASGMVILII
jgi:hypothetical protein